MYHDVETATVYLYLRSMYHQEELESAMEEVKQLSQKQFQHWFGERQAHFFKALLFVFLNSHSVVVLFFFFFFHSAFLSTRHLELYVR